MLTSSTVSIHLILIRESRQRPLVFMIELLRGQALSPVFANLDIVTGLVYEHTTIDPTVVQKLYEKNSLLVFAEGEDIKKYVAHCNPLRCGWVALSILNAMLSNPSK